MAGVATLVAVLALVASVAPAGAQEPDGGEVLVAAVLDGPAGPVVEQHRAASTAQAEQLVASLRARADVLTADVDVTVQALETDVETDTASVDPLRTDQWALDRLDAEAAWDIADASGQVVAVVDSGVDASHPDLDGAVLDGFDVFDPQSRGRIDPLTPCPGAPSECRGHGTHIAGIIAALVGNDIGVAGLARGAQILPVRVLDPAGFGSSSDVAQGVIFAADNGADVINLSLGSSEESSVLDFAVAYATRRGALVVAAAGNVGAHGGPMHPAVDPWTVAVGAADRDDQVVSFSGQGPWVDLAAPGMEIWSTRPMDGSAEYGRDSGTSMATPFVAAAAAMVQRHYPTLAPVAVAAHLRATATDLPPAGRDPASGDGLVDPVAALTRSPGTAVACDPGRMPRSGFSDVGPNTHRQAIDCAVWYEVTQGINTRQYAPSGPVTRGQMASFIARMLDRSGVELPSGGGDRFSDVSVNNVHREAINKLARAGIVQGHGTTYAPNRVVTRDQMASFLVRAYDHAQSQVGRQSLPPAIRQFADTAGNTHEPNINKAAAAGFAAGVTSTTYAPRQGVRRDQMATFVIRTMERLAR